METDWTKLHDATLISVTMEWEKGAATLEFAVDFDGHTLAKLVAAGITELRCPRQQPWGESVSVNEVRRSSPNAIDVEMQSGDVIQVGAESFSLELSP